MANDYTYDWLGEDWLKLKSQLLRLCVRHIGEMQAEDGSLHISHFHEYQEKVMADIQSRIPPDRNGLWSEALALLADFDSQAAPLEKDILGLAAGVTPAQALGKRLGFFLEDARREWYTLDTEESTARIKTWERLDRLSKKLLREQHSPEEAENIDRCTEPHFQEVHQHVKRHRAGNYNYPQKLVSIRDLFHIFCTCCRKKVPESEDCMDNYSSTREPGATLTEILFDGKAEDLLAKILARLSREHQEIIDAAFRLGRSDIGYLSESAYIRQNNITRAQFEAEKRVALQQLHIMFDRDYPQASAGVIS